MGCLQGMTTRATRPCSGELCTQFKESNGSRPTHPDNKAMIVQGRGMEPASWRLTMLGCEKNIQLAYKKPERYFVLLGALAAQPD